MPINEAPQYNKQHAVPQNIMDVEFKIIGELTLRQFAYIMIFGGIAYISAVYMSGLFRWPVTVLTALLGFGLAFVPLQERGLDQWIVNFFMAVYTPSQKIWRKDPVTPAIFMYQNMAVVKQELVTLAPTSSRRKLEEFLEKQDTAQKEDRLDIPETQYIQMAKEAFTGASSNAGIRKDTYQTVSQPTTLPYGENVVDEVEETNSSEDTTPVAMTSDQQTVPSEPAAPTQPSPLFNLNPAPIIKQPFQALQSLLSSKQPSTPAQPEPEIKPEPQQITEPAPAEEKPAEVPQEVAIPAPQPEPVEQVPDIKPQLEMQKPVEQKPETSREPENKPQLETPPSSTPKETFIPQYQQPVVPQPAPPVQPRPVEKAPQVISEPPVQQPVFVPEIPAQRPIRIQSQQTQQSQQPQQPGQNVVPPKQEEPKIVTRISTPPPASAAPAVPQIIKSRRRLYQPPKPATQPGVYVSSPITPDRHSGRRFTSLLPKQGEIVLPIRGEKVLKTSEEMNVEENIKNKTAQLNQLIDQIKQSKEYKKISEPPKPAPEPPKPAPEPPKPVEEVKEPPKPQISPEEIEKQKIIEEIKVLRSKVQNVRKQQEEEAMRKAREIYEATRKVASPPVYHQDKPKPEAVEAKAANVDEQRVVTPDIPNVITGFIRDAAGRGLTGVVVIVKTDSGKSVRAVKSNSLGQFTMATPLASGKYTLEIDTSHRSGYSFDIISTEVKGDIVPPLEIIGRRS